MTTPQTPVKNTGNLMLNNGSVAMPLKAGLENVIKAKSGEHYRITSRKYGTDQMLDNVIVKRVGDDLQLFYADGTQLLIRNYYIEAKGDAACDLTLPGQDGKTYKVSAEHTSGTDLGDGTTLIYAHGSHHALMNMALGNIVLHNTLASINGTELSYAPNTSIIDRIAGINPWWAAAGVAVVGGGAGAAMGMGGGSSHAAPPPPQQHNLVAGIVVAGPVVDTHDLTLNLYQADSITLIKGNVKISSTGTFSIDVGSYIGVVIAKVQNGGTKLDYMDETTVQATDLTAHLMAVGVAKTGTLTMNINVLTTVAAIKAGAIYSGASGNLVTSDTANHKNAAIASVFGLSDLLGSEIITTVDPTGHANVNYNKYGAVLAAFSGMDSINSGNMQATVDSLVAGITVTGSSGALSSTAINEVLAGALTAASNADSLTAVVSTSIAVINASVSIDNIATDAVINISEQSSIITGTTVSGAAVSLHIGNNDRTAIVSGTTWSYTLSPSDISAMMQGGDIITATATLIGGTTAVATRPLFIDTIAPSVTATHTALGHNATPVISGTAEAGATITAEIAGATYSTIAADGVWSIDTATALPASGTLALDVNGSNNVSVTAMDAAGNNTAPVTETFIIDTTVPTAAILTLPTDTGPSDSDGITSIGKIIVALAEDVDHWQYSTDGGTNWSLGRDGEFTLLENTYEANAVQVKSFDLAGNSSVGQYATQVIVDATVPSVTALSKSGNTLTISADAGSTLTILDGVTDVSDKFIITEVTAGNFTAEAKADAYNGKETLSLTVKATDTAGNVGPVFATPLTETIDTTAPTAAGLKLPNDTGSSDSDGITSNGIIDVTLAGDVDYWQCSIDAGMAWSIGEKNSFILAEGTYAANAIQVKSVDLAGNSSVAQYATQVIVIAKLPSVTALSKSGNTLTINADAGSTLTILDGVTDVSDKFIITEVTSGKFEAVAKADAYNGTETLSLTVKATDTAGNVGPAFETPLTGTIDSTAPTVAVLALSFDTANSTDGITSNALIFVTLAGDVDNWEYSSDAGSNWSTGTDNAFSVAVGSYAANDLQVRSFDALGNSNIGYYATPVIVDKIAPDLAGLVTDIGALSICAGFFDVTLAEDVFEWTYTTDRTKTWHTGTGTRFAIAEGIYEANNIQVRSFDVAGNYSISQYATKVIVDTTPPIITVLSKLDNTLTIAVDAGSTLTILDGVNDVSDNFTIFEVTPGNFTAEAKADAYDGTETLSLSVRATDTAGNVGLAFGTPVTSPIDTTAPTVADFTLPNDTGNSDVDGITTNGLIVVKLADDVTRWEFSADNGGTWTAKTGANFTVDEGSYAANVIQVKSFDALGNSSVSFYATQLVVDNTVPDVASIATNTEYPSLDNGLMNVTFAFDVVGFEYSSNGGVSWGIGTGESFGVTEGTYAVNAFQVKSFDAAGNYSISQYATSVIVDTTAPSVVALSELGNTLSITTEAASILTILDGDNDVSDNFLITEVTPGHFTALANENAYNGTETLSLTVKATDIAGNIGSAFGTPVTGFIDTTAPIVAALALDADTGINGDGITSNDKINVIPAVDVVHWKYSSDGGTNWSLGGDGEFTLAENTYEANAIQVKSFDLAGNFSIALYATQVIVDATAPSVTALSESGNTLTISANADSTLTILDSGTDVSNNFLITEVTPGRFTALANENAYNGTEALSLTVKATDIAGNIGSAFGTPVTGFIDTTAPIVAALTLDADTGINSDGVTSNGKINVTLATDVDLWQYSIDSGTNWSPGDGASLLLDEGSYVANAIQVKSFDLAGNYSIGQYATQVIVDTTAPIVTVLTESGRTLTIAVDAGSTITIIDGEIDVSDNFIITEVTPGSFEAVANDNAYDGTEILSLNVFAIDIAGNVELDFLAPLTGFIDTTAPVLPILALHQDTGRVTNDGITSNGLIDLTLAGDVDIWEYSIDEGTNWITLHGNTFDLIENTYAANTIQVKSFDAAGNYSIGQYATTVVVDATAPILAKLELRADTGDSSDYITSNGLFDVTLASDEYHWAYSTDRSENWKEGTGSSFTVAPGNYAAHDIQVMTFDLADNNSVAWYDHAVTIYTSVI